ncbi:MAG: hypothetical protein ACLGIV_08300, partial [Actinomycetes bacterium]
MSDRESFAFGNRYMAASVLSVAALLAPVGPTPSPNGVRSNISEDSIEIARRLNVPTQSRFDQTARAAPAEISYRYTSVPACTGNNPNSENADVFCPAAEAVCPPGELMYWLYRSAAEAAPGTGWTQVGQRCQGARDPAEPRPEIPGFTLADFQRLPLPAGTPQIEPDNGYTLIGVP